MSFKTAPRYLSGVSLFLGDDITSRNTDGELVFFIGQATQGPSVAIDLRSIDNIVPIYGNNNPLVKAAYQFWDGFTDSAQSANLRPIALRVGGIQASLTTSFGITITSTDAYDGIENDFFVFIDNSNLTPSTNNIKIWDKNKLLVYNQAAGINTGHFIVSGTAVPSNLNTYGVDLTGNPTAKGTTLANLALLDEVYYTGSATATTDAITPITTSILVTSDIQQIPSTGTLVMTDPSDQTKKYYTSYTIDNYALQNITIVPVNATVTAPLIGFVGSIMINGDSELNLTDRQLYEKFRNALLDVETFTPDYLVPGGPTFDAKGSFVEETSLTSNLTSAITGAGYAYVAGAANWPTSGMFTVTSTKDTVNYVSKTAQNTNGNVVYALETVEPVFQLSSSAVSGATSITLKDSTDSITMLGQTGTVQIGTNVLSIYAYTSVTVSNGIATLHLGTTLSTGFANAAAVKKKVIAANNLSLITTSTSGVTDMALGIGYVQETDNGDSFSFKWSNTKYVPVYNDQDVLVGHETYNLAHFGYLFANFCQEASVGYNTPLTAMNVSIPDDPNNRASVVKWIGESPSEEVQVAGTETVIAVVADGSGLLGDAVLAGSLNYNRCYMSNPQDSKFADPAYGLLLTEEGFVDGSEVKDTYGKLVDLGKFMCVGAGLLTFANRASGTPYVDTMGIYALGLLAGTPKNEGISFAKIGTRSNVSITSIVSRKLYNDLVHVGYIVPTREKGLGWVINNDNSAVRTDSGYFLISTTRTIKDVMERKRAILVGFIGKPMNRFYLEAAKTKIAESYSQDITNGFLNGFTFSLDQVAASTAIGKLLLKTSLNPPLELVQVDIDSVIDRNVVNQG